MSVRLWNYPADREIVLGTGSFYATNMVVPRKVHRGIVVGGRQNAPGYGKNPESANCLLPDCGPRKRKSQSWKKLTRGQQDMARLLRGSKNAVKTGKQQLGAWCSLKAVRVFADHAATVQEGLAILSGND